MSNSTYLITGITGYIGRMMAEKLFTDAAIRQEKINVIGIVRNKQQAKGLFSVENDLKVTYIEADILDLELCLSTLKKCGIKPDYIIHCAAPTQSVYMISNPVETAECIVIGTRNVLEMAKYYEISSMVYLSSMEVYGQIDCSDGRRVCEDELGNIDLFNVRSSYPLGKRMAENLCYSYYKEYNVPVKIARLAQTFGKGVSKDDTRVFAQFAKAVMEEKDIVLHTLGDSMGNYCDIDDAISAIMLILEKGKLGEAYNIVNESNTMTIREMAELVTNTIAQGQIKVIYDIPNENQYGYAAKTGLRLSSEKLRQLGWKSEKNMEDMYKEMIHSMKEQDLA